MHLALAIRNRGYTNEREQRLAEKSAWYQYTSDKTKTFVETAIYRVLKT
ncbi:hypothetical protein HUN01_28180 [Nostoc edaphicum CCNP1411]|uniref:Uncharacterized protein n=1 Tax=Nostoc edaphicum CCNP1411 TaxID=1472755 RepID=A0A7D7QQH8_9NOSO|nr:hypothetical protein [Nostoc edaphicum]QMS91285.1 hypothetical protein HUN01_28180 [Nostoc edaphicum CCNP1411]